MRTIMRIRIRSEECLGAARDHRPTMRRPQRISDSRRAASQGEDRLSSGVIVATAGGVRAPKKIQMQIKIFRKGANMSRPAGPAGLLGLLGPLLELCVVRLDVRGQARERESAPNKEASCLP